MNPSLPIIMLSTIITLGPAYPVTRSSYQNVRKCPGPEACPREKNGGLKRTMLIEYPWRSKVVLAAYDVDLLYDLFQSWQFRTDGCHSIQSHEEAFDLWCRAYIKGLDIFLLIQDA